VDAAYRAAFDAVLAKVQQHLRGAAPTAGPVRMYIAGGAALHLLTGERVTEDIDATFSKRVLIADEIAMSYRDPDGRARLLYLDRNYNDTLGLLHEDAYDDSRPVEVAGIDRKVLDVRVLSALDLAVSKLARFGEQDRADIELLARRGLIDAASLRSRADDALGGYVGDLAPVRTSIDIACRLVASLAPRKPAPAKRKARKR
jgi:hypothetical protein